MCVFGWDVTERIAEWEYEAEGGRESGGRNEKYFF